MVAKEQVKALVEAYLADTDYELQVIEIDKEQNILVEIDRLGVVDVDFCAALNRYLVEKLGDEDYSLEVGSVSLTAPFISKIQYQKHIGHEVEVVANGKKWHGQLVSVDEETFAIDCEVMVAMEGKKRKQKEVQTKEFRYEDAETRYDLKV